MDLSDLTYEAGYPADMDKSQPIYLFNPETGVLSTQPCVMYKSKISGKWTRSYLEKKKTDAPKGMTEFNTRR
jgi:hypothetical protein